MRRERDSNPRSSGYHKVTLYRVGFDDNGYINVNGRRVFNDSDDACCSASCYDVNVDITPYVHGGSNYVYGYADDCCGNRAQVYVYIRYE